MTYWEFKGRELVNCTCEYGCNCQFNALPDKGHCHAVAAVHVDEGNHGDTRPNGFEYEVAEIGSASSLTTGGPMEIEIESKYGQFANLHLSSHGVVRAGA